MIFGALDVFSETVLRAAIAFALVGVVLMIMNRFFTGKQGRRSDELQKKYEVMTRELLDSTPDEELIEAVVANLMAKQDKKNPQPYYTLPLLSRGRNAVYSIWLIHCELKENGFDVLYGGPSAPFCEPAVDGLTLIGATRCAKAVRDGEGLTDARSLADALDRYRAAEVEEDPLGALVAYIRDNPNEFIDGEPAAEAADTDEGNEL